MLAGLTSEIFRRTADGQRVYAPFGPSVFIVSERDAPRIERRIRRFFALLWLLIVPFWAAILGEGIWLPPLVALLATPVGVRWGIARGLPRLPRASVQLLPVNRWERRLAHARAVGPRWLWALFAACAIMVAVATLILVFDRSWWAWLGLAVFSLGGMQMASQLAVLRRMATGSGIASRHPRTG